MGSNYKLLSINPGSTSTKVGYFQNETLIYSETLGHDMDTLRQFKTVLDSFSFRLESIIHWINQKGIKLSEIDAIIGRGGLLKPIKSGTYIINDKMLSDLKQAIYGEHASNLGALLAYELSSIHKKPAYIVDPVSVDEMDDIARLTGFKEIKRKSTFHALNQKAIAKKVAHTLNQPYESLNLIVCHLGGGISVGVHEKGLVIDVNNALDGDGPMSIERSGTVPLGPLYHMCFSGNYTLEDIKKKNYGEGGLVSYLGTNDGLKIKALIDSGDKLAKKVFDAMCYQISKEIGAASTVLKGKVDAIILTGGLAYNTYLTHFITERVSFISKVIIEPGEDELLALAQGALRVLTYKEQAKLYD